MTESSKPTDPVKFVYGYGRTKHIFDPSQQARNNYRRYDGDPVGLCGAYGGYPHDEPQRPTCQRCAKIAWRLGIEAD